VDSLHQQSTIINLSKHPLYRKVVILTQGRSGFFRKVAQHQRAASDDPEAPITPVSIRHTSPQIASAAENELPPPLLDSKAEGAPQKFNHPDLQPSRDAGILYDMSTLFVAGVPKWSKDENLKGLFEPFGEIVDISFTTTS
jgi:hypothetical protein